MSGGPLIRIRLPRGDAPIVFGSGVPTIFTAAGVISRGRYGGMFAHFENHDGETWIVPALAARNIPTHHEGGVTSTIGELVDNNLMADYIHFSKLAQQTPSAIAPEFGGPGFVDIQK
jgi:hypothetical protein